MAVTASRTDVSGATGVADLRLLFHGSEHAPRAVLACDVLLGIDRPDLFEIRLVDRQPYFSRGEDSLPGPDEPIRVSCRDRVLFQGVVERVAFEDAVGVASAVVVTACSAYHFRRGRGLERSRVPAPMQRRAGREETSLRDLAWRIALDLGLEPHIECPDIVLPEVSLKGDPLRTLRRVAEDHGLELAVHGGELLLCGELPARGHARISSGRHGVTALEVAHLRGRRCRRARVLMPGLSTPRPLQTVTLAGFGAARDGRFRVSRCVCGLGPAGWLTQLEMEEVRESSREETTA